MSIASEITRLQNAKSNLKSKLQDKGVSVGNERLDEMVNLVENIETGTDTTDATATASDILKGKTAYVNDEKIEGIIETYDGASDVGEEVVGSSGIEEVNELPVANAENVGKIYKYQGQLYECKEVVDLVGQDEILNRIANPFDTMFYNAIINYHVVENEPNKEDMIVSGVGVFECYLAVDGAGAFVLMPDDVGEFFVTNMSTALDLTIGVGEYSSYNVPLDHKKYIVHFYDNVPIYDNSNLHKYYALDKYIVPKSVYLLDQIPKVNHLICEGDIFLIYKTPIVTLDISKTNVIPVLANSFDADLLTTIKVPSALLEQFKTATNWSNYADYMVGV